MQLIREEKIQSLELISPTELKLLAGSNLKIGARGYKIESDLNMDLDDIDTGVVAANTLYYVYAVASSGIVSLIYSESKIKPVGFNQYRKVGAFTSDESEEIKIIFSGFEIFPQKKWMQSIRLTGSGNKAGEVFRYPNEDVDAVNTEVSNIFHITDDPTNGTRINIDKKCCIKISASNGGPTISRGFSITKNGERLMVGVGVVSSFVDGGNSAISVIGNIGDYFDIRSTQTGFSNGELVVTAEEV